MRPSLIIAVLFAAVAPARAGIESCDDLLMGRYVKEDFEKSRLPELYELLGDWLKLGAVDAGSSVKEDPKPARLSITPAIRPGTDPGGKIERLQTSDGRSAQKLADGRVFIEGRECRVDELFRLICSLKTNKQNFEVYKRPWRR
jgi:hypothetical protein